MLIDGKYLWHLSAPEPDRSYLRRLNKHALICRLDLIRRALVWSYGPIESCSPDRAETYPRGWLMARYFWRRVHTICRPGDKTHPSDNSLAQCWWVCFASRFNESTSQQNNALIREKKSFFLSLSLSVCVKTRRMQSVHYTSQTFYYS